MLRRRTAPILGPAGRPLEGSLAVLEKVRLGGVDQWLLLRAVDRSQPILLLLHGGPGEPWIPYARRSQTGLERAFLVANWDQRGAGLSYRRGLTKEAMTIDRFVEDTIELSRRLLRRFDRDQILLSGHGWGSLVGLLAVGRAPELFEAYVGVGQFVAAVENARRMRVWGLEEAGRRGDRRAIRGLERLGQPPFDSPSASRALAKWVARLGGRTRDLDESRLFPPTFFDLPEYTLTDLLRRRAGLRFSTRSLGEEISKVDLRERVRGVRVPTYFMAGRHDHLSDPGLSREYLRALEAPRKGWAWVEDAAHLAPLEQPDAYAAALAHFAADARGPAPSWSVAG